jgi:hypothetical protein
MTRGTELFGRRRGARSDSVPGFKDWKGTMGVCRNSLRLLLVLLLNAVFVHAASGTYPLRIKVLSAETHALSGGTQVPKDCDLQNFSAYCNESTNPTSQSVMIVQDADGKSYRITCTTASRWSKCVPLPVGQTFDAYKQKQGITILSWDSKGKARKQFYQLVAVASGAQSSPAAAPQSRVTAAPPNPPVPASAPQAAAPVQISPTPAPVAAPAAAPGSVLQQGASQKVRCNFSSTPPGADITVDWRYVGNTPSEIGLTPGTHVVVVSMEGFAEWKRELTVGADSAVNVTANLQKTQP